MVHVSVGGPPPMSLYHCECVTTATTSCLPSLPLMVDRIDSPYSHFKEASDVMGHP